MNRTAAQLAETEASARDAMETGKETVQQIGSQAARTAEKIVSTAKDGIETASEQVSAAVGNGLEAGKSMAKDAGSELAAAFSGAGEALANTLAEHVKTRPIVALGTAVLAGLVIGNMLRGR